MTELTALIVASAAFTASHLIMSHPLRAPLVARLGDAGFMIAYTVISFATFGWMVAVIRTMPPETPLWSAPEWLWPAAAFAMLVASILLAGSLIGNPALPAPGANAAAAREPRGVLAITRHPMMWSFALWGAIHAAIWPTPSVLVITAAITLLALAGAAGQDLKKAKLMGDDWTRWVARTGFVPFTGPSPLVAMWPGWGVIAAGTALWLLATWAHGLLGAPLVGVWR